MTRDPDITIKWGANWDKNGKRPFECQDRSDEIQYRNELISNLVANQHFYRLLTKFKEIAPAFLYFLIFSYKRQKTKLNQQFFFKTNLDHGKKLNLNINDFAFFFKFSEKNIKNGKTLKWNEIKSLF